MAKRTPGSVDAYVAALPADGQAVARRVRSALRRALPRAEEIISYQIPAYRTPAGVALYFACWKTHYALYPVTSKLVAAMGEQLSPYVHGKGTLRFPLSGPVPVKLIERIARWRAKELALPVVARRASRSTAGRP